MLTRSALTRHALLMQHCMHVIIKACLKSACLVSICLVSHAILESTTHASGQHKLGMYDCIAPACPEDICSWRSPGRLYLEKGLWARCQRQRGTCWLLLHPTGAVFLPFSQFPCMAFVASACNSRAVNVASVWDKPSHTWLDIDRRTMQIHGAQTQLCL